MPGNRPPVGDDDADGGIFQRLADTVQRGIDVARCRPADPSLARTWAGRKRN